MIAQTVSNPGTTKLKFFLTYAFSVVLVAVIVLSIFRGEENASTPANSTPVVNNDDAFFFEANTALQNKMQVLSKAYLDNVAHVQTGEKPAAVQTAENDMRKALDEVKSKNAGQENTALQGKTENLISFFESEMNRQGQLYAHLLQKEQASSNAATVQNNAELQQLKDQLSQKEKEIASLQANLREKPKVIERPASDDSKQWKDRAVGLKAANDKLSKQIATITASYQIIVEDNRRLLSRLQASKKQ